MKIATKQLARGLFEVTKGKSGPDLDEAVKGFVQYLAERHERSRWRDVIRALDDIWKKEYGAATVDIKSSHEISEKIIETIEKAYKGAEIRTEIDEALIGGASIRIDDRIVDGTIKTQLESLKHELSRT